MSGRLLAVSCLSESGVYGSESYLQQVLVDNKVSQVFIMGMLADRSVQSSALDLAQQLPDADIVVVEDGCRGANALLVADGFKKACGIASLLCCCIGCILC
jgi:nicotinamidase-related amidase